MDSIGPARTLSNPVRRFEFVANIRQRGRTQIAAFFVLTQELC